ncbi:glycosyltransferase [Flavobacterium branchiophilum]|uniref:Glycosyl transferase, group 2 family protein n=2 Tax=Flavobacterium branchiophilum TaxID=55197 RepID=G2Z131_FLABF|nr:glycosyltransferase family 2 protein [Flavobacterium branchiophilum]OXA69929.1 glycosyltransferase [Flavobacterium branchiophilum] [Flavobacterium branchiophilum NBRC 15030 = ATCC 35035]TQM42038.1 dolichol-phosphate mannosyltransferase [Flavobacterium branchiophilum]GEM53809.1 glycosyl transferase family 2 [Flavobacterium branchiophilum NBRC 15030 = ATCC 35035]CCB69591.1 Glycosyl transferase, group 2 family protein [Flavobacterium branchiophilum FL-15]
MKKNITIVIPSYNEATNIPVMIDALHKVLEQLPYLYKIVFVDDGSSDNSLSILENISKTDSKVFYIQLSRNFGHQNALKAGVDFVRNQSAAIITMDGDMQHPPELIANMLEKWEEHYDVVYTIREEDKDLSWFKNKTSKGFYSLINQLSEVKIEPGTADFRLMDRKVADVFSNFSENELFIRGLISWVGFKQFAIHYKPNARFSGKSKYTIVKMIRFAMQGITSFSTRPLYLAVFLGVVLSAFAFLFFIIYVLYSVYFGHVISGWASLISTVVFFGGLNLIVLGIIGIYVGKMFIQSKNRPNYLISKSNFQ